MVVYCGNYVQPFLISCFCNYDWPWPAQRRLQFPERSQNKDEDGPVMLFQPLQMAFASAIGRRPAGARPVCAVPWDARNTSILRRYTLEPLERMNPWIAGGAPHVHSCVHRAASDGVLLRPQLGEAARVPQHGADTATPRLPAALRLPPRLRVRAHAPGGGRTVSSVFDALTSLSEPFF